MWGKLYFVFLLGWVTWWSPSGFAGHWPCSAEQRLVGQMQTVMVSSGETLMGIARRYDVGYYELIEANPGIERYPIEPGTMLIIPGQSILPALPHRGIVVNLADMRLYYYPDDHTVMTFPVGIGRVGEETPLGLMTITEKRTDPVWIVPPAIRKARAAEGLYLPAVVYPGPENPLGHYALRLSKPTYLIHGTNDASGVGRRSSSGCLRMYPEDIVQLYARVTKGTQVRIINQPVKFAWQAGQLYMERHQPVDLREFERERLTNMGYAAAMKAQVGVAHAKTIDQALAAWVYQRCAGWPVVIAEGEIA